MGIKDTRLANLRHLVADFGSVAEVARRSGVNEKCLGQILNAFKGSDRVSPRAVGDKVAEKLEDGCGKERGWMDAVHKSSTPSSVRTSTVEMAIPGDTTATDNAVATRFSSEEQAVIDALRQLPPGVTGELARFLGAINEGRASAGPDLGKQVMDRLQEAQRRRTDGTHADEPAPAGGAARHRRNTSRSR